MIHLIQNQRVLTIQKVFLKALKSSKLCQIHVMDLPLDIILAS